MTFDVPLLVLEHKRKHSPNDQKLSHAAGDFRQPKTRSEN